MLPCRPADHCQIRQVMGRVVQATDKDRRVGPAQTKKTADERTGGETTSEALPHAYETAMRIPARGMRVMLKLAAFGSDPRHRLFWFQPIRNALSLRT